MELEQSRIVHESMMKGKDLTIQKLLLQVRTSFSFILIVTYTNIHIDR